MFDHERMPRGGCFYVTPQKRIQWNVRFWLANRPTEQDNIIHRPSCAPPRHPLRFRYERDRDRPTEWPGGEDESQLSDVQDLFAVRNESLETPFRPFVSLVRPFCGRTWPDIMENTNGCVISKVSHILLHYIYHLFIHAEFIAIIGVGFTAESDYRLFTVMNGN